MRLLTFLLPLALLAPALSPRLASACGGTFCDRPVPTPVQPNPPPPMPVDQTGENILFVMDGSKVEAHIQIQYTGDPERFAWIVPVQAEPSSIEPGSQPLFTNMANATVPRLKQAASTVRDSCGSSGLSGGTFGCGADSADPAASSGDAAPFASGAGGGSSGASSDPGLQVKEKVVGAYETATLSGGTADELLVWLDENNYAIPPNTAELLASYLVNKYVFVALKLTAGAGLDEIHPIVFTYPGDQPCIPIKLTAVAAKEDMGIRAFFLASERFVPKNFKHIILNDARFDWLAPFVNQGGTSGTINPNASASAGPPIDLSGYKNVVSKAVDSPVANGRAFVTEYAGQSSRVDRAGITSFNWISSPLKKAKPEQVPNILIQQKMLDCSKGSACTASYPITLLLLHKYLPVPPGQSETGYYTTPSKIAQQFQGQTFEAEAFAAEYESMVLKPSIHAADVLNKLPLLTRLFTTISPGEMTEDPEFRRLPGGAPVDNTGLTTTRHLACDGRQTRMLPSGREVLVTPKPGDTASWPQFADDMPWVERIEDFSSPGPGVVLVDNKTAIDDALVRFHQPLNWPPATQFGLATDYGNCTYERGSRTSVVRAGLALALALALARRQRRRGAGALAS